jgi:hypothetical protein
VPLREPGTRTPQVSSRVLAGSSRSTCPVTILASGRHTAHRKSACWALRRLDGQRQTCAVSRGGRRLRCHALRAGLRSKGPALPTTNREGVDFHSDYIPLPLTCPQVSARRVQPARWREPELPHVFRTDVDAIKSAGRVCAGHKPANQIPADRQKTPFWIPPLGIRRGPPNRVSAGQRPSRARGGR